MRLALVADAGSVNVRSWADGLAAAGADVDLISFGDDPTGGRKVRRLPARGPASWRARYLLAGPSVRRVVEDLDPDVVVGYYVTGYGTVARLARRHPLVMVVAGNDVLVNPAGTVTHALARRNLRNADLVVAWSEHLAVAAAAFGVPRQRTLVLPRGIPLDRFGALPDTTGDPRRLVVTRALDPYYRHEVLLRAVAEVGDDGLSIDLAGSGPAAPALAAEADRLGLSGRVRFLGPVPHEQVPRLLADHGVYVSACPTDGLSASLLEAMAAGLFPVVVDHVANRDWVEDGVTGFLVDGTPSGFAAALRAVVSTPSLLEQARARNPRLVRERADLSRNSALFVERFTALAGGGGAAAAGTDRPSGHPTDRS